MSKRFLLVWVLASVLFLSVLEAQGQSIAPVRLRTPAYKASQSNCHENPTYPDPDSIIITVSGDDITVLHKDAFYNCCFEISVEVIQQDDIFNLYEHTSGEECDCLCYFDISTTICDLEPGTYMINVYNADGQYVGGGTVTIGAVAPTPIFK